ncbi:hypothetical protein ABTJ98_20060, partial [Acinetobacter baumannii]
GENKYKLKILPADIYYSPELKQRLNARIEKMIVEYKQQMDKKVIETFLEKPEFILDVEYRDYLLSLASIPDNLKEKINQYAKLQMTNNYGL